MTVILKDESLKQPSLSSWIDYQTIFDIGMATFLLIIAVASFLIALPVGLLVIFILTLGFTLQFPAKVPAMLIIIFLIQNMIIAAFLPFFPPQGEDEQIFTAIRGINFAILMTCFSVFLLSVFVSTRVILEPVRPWLHFILALLGAIIFYLFLGMIRGEPSDALIYFRNTLIPIAAFFITLIAASNYYLNLDKILIGIGVFAIIFGYLELTFTFDFLNLFNGGAYHEANMVKQIQSGYWEQVMKETGFVVRNLDDVMMTSLFNTSFFGDIFPKVFRLSGPNFHPISFAYALSIISAWMLYQNRFLFLLFAFPLLIVVGSKGALILLLMAMFVKISLVYLPPKIVLVGFFSLTLLWLVIVTIMGLRGGDYHVIGLVSGLREFIKNPFGQGLGIGGNLSSITASKLDWNAAQRDGATQIPVESALGVLLYQMGVAGLMLFVFLIALIRKCIALFYKTGDQSFVFGIVSMTTLMANAVLQEEAFYAPLALGLCLILVASVLGTYWQGAYSASYKRVPNRISRLFLPL